MTTQINPIASQSSPLLLSTTQTFKTASPINNDIQEEEEEDDDEQFLDASEELPQQEFTLEPSQDSTNQTASSSSAHNYDIVTGKPFGRRSIIVGIDYLNNRVCVCFLFNNKCYLGR